MPYASYTPGKIIESAFFGLSVKWNHSVAIAKGYMIQYLDQTQIQIQTQVHNNYAVILEICLLKLKMRQIMLLHF